MDNKGYVVFSYSRQLGPRYYKWMVKELLVPWVKKIREFYELDESSTAYFQVDGETAQLEAIMDSATIAILNKNHIKATKPPGSTSSVTRPCDNGNCFRGPKAALKKLNNDDVLGVKFLEKQLDSMFEMHNEWLNSAERGANHTIGSKRKFKKRRRDVVPRIEMNPAHARMAKLAILRVQYVLQNTMKPSLIKESFANCGIKPYMLRRILANFNQRPRVEQFKILKKVMPSLSKTMAEQGELMEEDFMQKGISIPSDCKTKDTLVLNQRRTCILTNKNLIEREMTKRKRKRGDLDVSVDD